MKAEPIIRHQDETADTPCPYGSVHRIVTGGEGTANIHVVKVAKGGKHFHKGYDESYYFLSGTGTITLNDKTHFVRPGTVVVIPAGIVHSLVSDSDAPLEFIIFGTPPMSMEDDQARPIKPTQVDNQGEE